jgi:exonuclease III
MLSTIFNILCWNVRGLNDPDRCSTVNEIVATSTCHIVCLQETKLESVSPADAYFIGGNRLKSFAEKPAVGTRGGILLLWDETVVRISNIHVSEFSLSATVFVINSGEEFKLTTVYGPSTSTRKDEFFNELRGLKPLGGVKWLALGDFNQIYRAHDKNKANVNQRRINRFRSVLHDCELKEIPLQNRIFTWRN